MSESHGLTTLKSWGVMLHVSGVLLCLCICLKFWVFMSCDKNWNWHSQSACGSFFISVLLLVYGDHEALKIDLTSHVNQKRVTGKMFILHKAKNITGAIHEWCQFLSFA